MDTKTNSQNGTSAPANAPAAPATTLEIGNLNQTFPLPSETELTVGDKTYRFCSHCHTPKPSAQVDIDPKSKHPGICINCVNGINNYDKLVALGILKPRPGTKVIPVETVRIQRVVPA